MKFQNPIFNFFLNGQKQARMDKLKPSCSPHFQSWGHNKLSGYLLRRQNLSSQTMILTHKVFVVVV